ncbi:hypothetical protein [Pseudomonas sp. PNPG3]|nr:hypothetical protein [Pseudomonas sp. PNPG3]MCK2123980.1 hypothetical protein [Pseudomonas sp. PNPG3]
MVYGQWPDPVGTQHDLGKNGGAEVADRYAEPIEDGLWHLIDAKRAA